MKEVEEQRSSKPLKIIFISLLVLAILGTALWMYGYTRKHSVDVKIAGVNYQLGEENNSNVQAETVTIKGHWSRSLKGVRTFKGTIDFANRQIPVPEEESREVTVRFTEKGYGPVVYFYIDNRNKWDVKPKIHHDGDLFVNSDFSSVSYIILSETRNVSESGTVKRSWDGDSGLMFAGPATTREQALAISNALMEQYFTHQSYENGRFILK